MPRRMLRNEIYATLNEVNEAGNFHWSIFVVDEENAESIGWQIHAAHQGTDAWCFESTRWNGPQESNALAFVKIGSIMKGLDVDHLVEYLKDIPMVVPEDPTGLELPVQFSSRVWFREAIRFLNDSQMFVYCPNVDVLMREITAQGVLAENQIRGPHRRPIVTVSTVARAWPDDE